MFCSRCGKEIADNSKFCGACGNKVSGKIEDSNSNILKVEKIKSVLTEGIKVKHYRSIIIICCLVISGIFVISVFQHSSRDFGVVSWGMTKEEVIKKEGKRGNKRYEESGDHIRFYGVKIDGETVDVNYNFDRNSLTGAKYELYFKPRLYGVAAANKQIKAFEKRYGDYVEDDYGGGGIAYTFSEDKRTEVVLDIYTPGTDELYITFEYYAK